MWNDRTSQNYLSHENKAFIIFHPILLCWLFWLLNVDTPKMGYSIIVNPRISKVGVHPFPCKSNSYCRVTSWLLHCCRMIQKMSLQQVGISRTGRESMRETTQMNEKNGSIFWYHFFLTTVAHYVTLFYDDIQCAVHFFCNILLRHANERWSWAWSLLFACRCCTCLSLTSSMEKPRGMNPWRNLVRCHGVSCWSWVTW